jgi:hypothetical protein
MKTVGFLKAFVIFWILTASHMVFAEKKRADGLSADGMGVLTLADGSKFNTVLYHMRVIGQLRTTKKVPYFILSGTTCSGCDENISIYIHSPSDGEMKNEAQQRRFAYPGREKDYATGQLVYEAKMFYGNCLAAHPNAVVWFDRVMGEDKNWHSGVSIAKVSSDKLVVRQLHAPLPKQSDVRDAVHRGECLELPGVDRDSEP